MSLILNIDTALELASVSLAQEGEIVQSGLNKEQTDHAAWLHPTIDGLLKKAGLSPGKLDAVAVSIGPGSYTGLRVGLATAKGFCYALEIPLITIGTLELIAFGALPDAEEFIGPVIDARRMEVFAAVYDKELAEIIPPRPLVIEEKSFDDLLASHKILFCGTGSDKLKKSVSHSNARFAPGPGSLHPLARLSHKYFREKRFAGLAYAEPLYLKEFFTVSRKK